MIEKVLPFIAILAPTLFVSVALASWYQPGFKPKNLIRFSQLATTLSIIIATICSIYVANHGLIESSTLGFRGVGLSVRLDALSLLMLAMIALLSFVIVKFSGNYLDGDQRQGAFIGRLAATIASVQLLVLAGNMGLLFISWVFTSMSLHRLLIFYASRPGAQIAARKKFIVARLADVCLLLAFTLLYHQFKTGNLQVIFTAIQDNFSSEKVFIGLELIALFLALAAILKSAQFPSHGWLIEVMETPTPVSALLHAGLLNAGPFLIIRMAFVLDFTTIAPIVLMSIGGFTALFASIVYLTQTSVKTALGYSSVGHMGFSLMLCGLGVYSAAMLHLVAHSFYKAHAFLSSGSVIDAMQRLKTHTPPKKVRAYKAILGFIMALLLYTGFALSWGLDLKKELSLVGVGALITFGLAKFFTTAITHQWNLKLLAQTALIGIAITFAFFCLEGLAQLTLQHQVPELSTPGLGKQFIGSIILLSAGAIVIVQMLAARFESKAKYQALAIHTRNGFYANAWFDRIIGALRYNTHESPQKRTASIQVKHTTHAA